MVIENLTNGEAQTLLYYRKELLNFLSDLKIEAFSTRHGSDVLLRYKVDMGPTAVERCKNELRKLDTLLFKDITKESLMVFGYLPRKAKMDVLRRRQFKHKPCSSEVKEVRV